MAAALQRTWISSTITATPGKHLRLEPSRMLAAAYDSGRGDQRYAAGRSHPLTRSTCDVSPVAACLLNRRQGRRQNAQFLADAESQSELTR